MKKILAYASLFMMLSCSTTYQQIVTLASPDTKLHNDGEFVYDGDDYVIYYNFWSEGGNVSFLFTNNSDEDVYLDLTRSFFIVNGLTFDYFQNRSWSSNSSNTVTSSSSYGFSNTIAGAQSYANASATSLSGYTYGTTSGGSNSRVSAFHKTISSTVNNGVYVSEKPGVWVPAHSSRVFKEFSLMSTPYRQCGFARNPRKKEDSSLSFKENNTPYTFENMLMIIVGDKDHRILNKFYVESFKNMRREDTYIDENEKNCSGENTGEEIRIYKFAANNKFYINYGFKPKIRGNEYDRVKKSSSRGLIGTSK